MYQYLEPLYNDYRKVRERLADGGYGLTHVDEVVDKMLQRDHLFDISLPRIPLRSRTLARLFRGLFVQNHVGEIWGTGAEGVGAGRGF